MPNVIGLKTFSGTNVVTGEVVQHAMDEITCNGTRIGFVDHVEGAPVRFLRVLTPPTVKSVLEDVAKIRKEQGKAVIGSTVSQPPSPDKIAAYMDSIEGDDDDE